MSVVTLRALERRNGVLSEDDPASLCEAFVLNAFWALSRGTADRLGLLRAFGQLVIRRPATWDVAAIRRDHETPPPEAVRLTRSACFGCEANDGPVYFHHIIEIQHGGSNAVRNKVPLCFACHAYLHPWLRDQDPHARNGVTPLDEMFGELTQVIAALQPIDREDAG